MTNAWPFGNLDPCDGPAPALSLVEAAEVYARLRLMYSRKTLPIQALADLWTEILVRDLEKNPPPGAELLIVNKHSLGAS